MTTPNLDNLEAQFVTDEAVSKTVERISAKLCDKHYRGIEPYICPADRTYGLRFTCGQRIMRFEALEYMSLDEMSDHADSLWYAYRLGLAREAGV